MTSPTGQGLTVEGHVLVEALVLDLWMWARHQTPHDPAASGHFPPEVRSVCERVTLVDEHALGGRQTEGLRLLHRDGGAWAVWRGRGDDERFYRQEILAAAMSLSGLRQALDRLKVDERDEREVRPLLDPPPGYRLIRDGEWPLIDEMLAAVMDRPTTGPVLEATQDLGHAAMENARENPAEFLRAASATLAHRVMSVEFDDYARSRGDDARTRPFPRPMLPGGRPAGWQVRWEQRSPETDPGIGRLARRRHRLERMDVVVVERDGSGWGLLVHALDTKHIPFTTLYDTAALDPISLYRTVEALASLSADVAGPERTLREFLLTHYDLTDPTEEAVATMAALGAPVRHFPKSLTRGA